LCTKDQVDLELIFNTTLDKMKPVCSFVATFDFNRKREHKEEWNMKKWGKSPDQTI
jgi:hypothetical protein